MSNTILVQTKVSVIIHTLTKCPKLSIGCKGIEIPNLLDLGSEVTLIYCLKNLMPVVGPSNNENTEANCL